MWRRESGSGVRSRTCSVDERPEQIEHLVRAATSEEGQAAQQALLEDERRFIDVANSPIWLGEEIAVVGAP